MSLQVLMNRIVAQPVAIRKPVIRRKPLCSSAKAIEALPATSMEESATALVRQDRHRLSSQLRIIGPNSSLDSSQSCHRGDERAKNQAASKIKGVLGSTGNGMPSSPSARNRKPSGL